MDTHHHAQRAIWVKGFGLHNALGDYLLHPAWKHGGTIAILTQEDRQAPPARTRNMGKGKGVGKGVGVGMGMGSPPPVGRKSLSLHAECVPMLSPLQLLHPTHTQGEDSFSPTSPFSAHSETCVTEVTCDTEMSTETEVDEVEVEEECEVDVSVELSAPTLPNAIWCLPLPSLSLLAEEAQEAQAERALCAGVSLDRSAGEQPLISE
ncbi:hypothetical protein B484DRAFT_425536, partial [Ochromonadaceae sp. CCMP2298]